MDYPSTTTLFTDATVENPTSTDEGCKYQTSFTVATEDLDSLDGVEVKLPGYGIVN